MSVVPVGRDEVVVLTQKRDRPNRNGFFTAVKVKEPAHLPEIVVTFRAVCSKRRIRHICLRKKIFCSEVSCRLTSAIAND